MGALRTAARTAATRLAAADRDVLTCFLAAVTRRLATVFAFDVLAFATLRLAVATAFFLAACLTFMRPFAARFAPVRCVVRRAFFFAAM
jgi:hypothetical protein